MPTGSVFSPPRTGPRRHWTRWPPAASPRWPWSRSPPALGHHQGQLLLALQRAGRAAGGGAELWERTDTEDVIAQVEAAPDPHSRLHALLSAAIGGRRAARRRRRARPAGRARSTRWWHRCWPGSPGAGSTTCPSCSRSSASTPRRRRRALLAYTAYLGHAQLAHATPELTPRGPDLPGYVDASSRHAHFPVTDSRYAAVQPSVARRLHSVVTGPSSSAWRSTRSRSSRRSCALVARTCPAGSRRPAPGPRRTARGEQLVGRRPPRRPGRAPRRRPGCRSGAHHEPAGRDVPHRVPQDLDGHPRERHPDAELRHPDPPVARRPSACGRHRRRARSRRRSRARSPPRPSAWPARTRPGTCSASAGRKRST